MTRQLIRDLFWGFLALMGLITALYVLFLSAPS